MVDLIFTGGGLASCLTAYRLRQCHPQLEFLIVEGSGSLGGNHTWSFFPTDLTAEQLDWIDPLVLHRWTSYEVRFPALTRTLDSGYCSTHSDFFHTFMMGALGDSVQLRSPVEAVTPTSVTLAGGETLEARCVIDGRGAVGSPHVMLGFQKFTGQVLQLEADHGLAGPVIMDATVPQNGDYRFVYTLPFGPREVMVEDTRYSTTPELDATVDSGAIADYARSQGWTVAGILREERGSLPITLGGDIDAFWADADGVPRIGLRGAMFHATTGYSFADAIRTADEIARAGHIEAEAIFRLASERSKAHWQAQAYHRFLNRMLFLAAEPDRRWFVMQRFYGLPQPLIERFYGGRSTLKDKLRILTGKPPVAILRALRCLPERSAAAHTIEVLN
ncbi:MAG: lycopene beta-cyclase CrtY [Gammaproteobacteria bacterium]